MTGIDVIREYKHKKGEWLPMIDHAGHIVPAKNEYGEVNIGWNAGLIEENRPYFVECWATDGITMITIFMSTKGIENMTAEQIDVWFQKAGYYKLRENAYKPEVRTFSDHEGNELFSINIVVGDEENTYMDGAPIIAYKVLNDYNTAEKDVNV